jgi:hypothetical protein
MHPGILISKSGKSIVVVESEMRPVWEIKISFTELICINSIKKKRGRKGWGGEGREGVVPMLAQLTPTN